MRLAEHEPIALVAKALDLDALRRPALTGKKGAKRGIGKRATFSSPKDPSWLKDPLPEGVSYQRHENYERPV